MCLCKTVSTRRKSPQIKHSVIHHPRFLFWEKDFENDFIIEFLRLRDSLLVMRSKYFTVSTFCLGFSPFDWSTYIKWPTLTNPRYLQLLFVTQTCLSYITYHLIIWHFHHLPQSIFRALIFFRSIRNINARKRVTRVELFRTTFKAPFGSKVIWKLKIKPKMSWIIHVIFQLDSSLLFFVIVLEAVYAEMGVWAPWGPEVRTPPTGGLIAELFGEQTQYIRPPHATQGVVEVARAVTTTTL